MTLTLSNFTSSLDLPRTRQQINMNDGIFIGGIGTSDIPYISGDILTFRGCILEAQFNNLDLFSHYDSLIQFHGQWEHCYPGITPSSDGSFGYLGPRSYMVFPSWDISSHGTIQLTLETSRPGRAPLLYQPGPQKSFFYVEIIGGQLKGTIYTGKSSFTFEHLAYISDSRPHSITISVDKSEIQLAVDKMFSKFSIDDLQQELDFSGNMYLGGVDETTLATMRETLLGNMYIEDMEYRSFTGCLKDVIVNSVQRSFHDAVLAKDIVIGCQTDEYGDYVEYDGTSTQYYISPTLPQSTTTAAESKTNSKLSDKCKLGSNFNTLTSLLNPQPMTVSRGGSSFLKWEQIHPTVDLGKAGIRQSQVVLRLIGKAHHGQLVFDIPGAETRGKFTLLDVTNNKVRYSHDGSESNEDELVMEVDILNTDVTECLNRGQRYRIPVNVLPAFSAPTLFFPKGETLTIMSHGQKPITPDVIKIEDHDTPCDQLTIYVSKNYTEDSIEVQGKQGETIQKFSCINIEEGEVTFIHRSGNQSQLLLQASDGISTSAPALISFLALDPQITESQSSDLEVTRGASVIITNSNVPIVTNADLLGLEVVYRIAESPRYGEVQKLMDGGDWKTTGIFKKSDLEKSGVRYLNTVSNIRLKELSEDLIIQVLLGTNLLSNATLQVKVKKASFQIRKMVPLKIGSKREMSITDKEIQIDIIRPGHHRMTLTYFITQSPKKGNLQINGHRIIEGSHFTQNDLQNELLSYIATVRNTEHTEDQFQFQVMTGAQMSPVYIYKIEIDVDPDAPHLTNQVLHVLEGEEEAITPKHLFLVSSNIDSFFYEVIDGPQHGSLIRKKSSRAREPVDIGLTEFTNDDIRLGHIFYQHDGSETTEDDIPFVASMLKVGSGSDASGEEEENVEEEVVRGVFRISVQPVNDNPPIQIVHKIFHVIRNGQRLLTTNDIAFSDPDSGSTDTQLVMISGPEQGSVQLQVSDGLHQLTTILEVQASEPFIHIPNNTVLYVFLGRQVTLKDIGLQMETNLDIYGEAQVKYYIISQPRWGNILKEGELTDSFSQEDLLEGKVVYQHGGTKDNKDQFRITVEANDIVATGNIEILIFSESLNVIHNEKLYVFQGDKAEIRKENLMVFAKGKVPHKVVYTLTDPPSFGYLVAISPEPSSDGSQSLDTVETFTQEDINQGKILYLHSDSDMLPDSLTLEVTAGEESPQELVMQIEILPINIPLVPSELEVEEGGTATLSNNTLQISNTFFIGLDLEFTILTGPKRGRIVNPESATLRGFSWNEVNLGEVLYEHDGSETLSDNFTVVVAASAITRQSLPTTVSVSVRAINDEKPQVVTNAGMQILEGATAVISAQALYSIDVDSPKEELVYTVLPSANGQLTILGSTKGIFSFSQKQLEQGDVQFTQHGDIDGGFFFNVSDGENQSEENFFAISVIPLAITMETLQDLAVCPGSTEHITSQSLKAATNQQNNQLAELLYHIDESPNLGNIVRLADGEATAIINFTQSEIEAGIISYKHTAIDTPFWIKRDSFSFHLTSNKVVSQRYIMNMTVTFEEHCPQLHTRLWKNTGTTVMEGSSSVITSLFLDAANLLANISSSSLSYDVLFLLTTLPSWGYLSIGNVPIETQFPYFLQSHLQNGKLQYTHIGPGILEDSFHFKAWLWPTSQTIRKTPPENGMLVISESFNLTVISVPKIPLQVSTPKLQVQVAPGSYVVLTGDHLFVEAPFIPLENIHYKVLNMPKGISLATKRNHFVQSLNFTQKDIALQNIIILANRTAASGSIHVNITTGNQSPLVAILPVKVSPLHNSVLEVPQELTMALLTTKHVTSTEVEIQPNILYKVSQPPKYGKLLVKHAPVSEFWWNQVKDNEVSYVFNNFVSSQDEFGFLAISNGTEERAGIVSVTVKAMVNTGDTKIWPRGYTVKLESETMDAKELGTYTLSDPLFRVLQQPSRGRLVKYPREKESKENKTINYFTQSEIDGGMMGLEIWEDEHSDMAIQNDSIQFEVSAKNVPPANVLVKFTTTPFNASYSFSTEMYRTGVGLETKIPDNNTTMATQNPSLPRTTHLQHTTNSESSTKQITTDREVSVTDMVTATSLLPTMYLIPITSHTQTYTTTKLASVKPNVRMAVEDTSMGTTQEVSLNSSFGVEVSNSTIPSKDLTLLGFMNTHKYSVILPVCLVLFLIVVGLLLLFYLLRKKKMGKHHVQKAASSYAKPENGANDHQSFRPTEPDRAIPLNEVGSGHKGNGAGGHGQPGSQYWV
ncbi:hypothetical protein GDO86_006155 [Hymenochirus boettgeri]|uniref:Laminin G domain-containing protein n=1 Tax=Hymenochirus boettgeri TaxID=247094 RepID=A0A8T2J9Y9_9PIPI|nr:hypothetical protein GDO86_006155 [Hymenochirus boettgeri]